jgi:hypothetical protein
VSREGSIAVLAPRAGGRVLIVGVGNRLDLPHLPRHAAHEAVDLTPAMLRRAVHAVTHRHLTACPAPWAP